jgi:hypothetical protein
MVLFSSRSAPAYVWRAPNVEGTKWVPCAVIHPRVTPIGGKEIKAVYSLIVPVPSKVSVIGKVDWAEDHEIRLTALQGDSRNARDGDLVGKVYSSQP